MTGKKQNIISQNNQKPRVLSFFTGCGGLDLGFEKAGFNTIYATDIDKDSCDTLSINRGNFFSKDMAVERCDIITLDPKKLPHAVDLVIGGPPCQSFSASGRRAGGAAGRLDQRGLLFEAYCKIISHVQPKAFVFENVRGILGTNKGEDWKAITQAFGDIGYTISYRLLDALDYGVPQQRERMFLVGHQLDMPFLFPEPTHGPDSVSGRPHITTQQAFSDIDETEDLQSLKLHGGKYSHLLPLVPPGQNYLYFTAKRGHPKPIFAYRSRFSDFLYKANPETPVKTIIASPGKYTGPLHWENRYFSIQEYMRLQGFPTGFRFSGSRADIIRQIGNSVSPLIAHQIALAIANQIFGWETGVRLIDTDKALSFDRRKGEKARKTRAMHEKISAYEPQTSHPAFFSPISYVSTENLGESKEVISVVRASYGSQGVSLRVETDGSQELFAKMILTVKQSSQEKASSLKISVSAYGHKPGTVQAMWNAVDEWVRRCSGFHSLFEIYGHFTEPHPLFEVNAFEAFSQHPIAYFAKHASNFRNCSRYFPKSHLVEQFREILGTSNFSEISTYLRRYRFDIRSKETNVAIQSNEYMVAYPFNLPSRRQMNFRVHQYDDDTPSDQSGAIA